MNLEKDLKEFKKQRNLDWLRYAKFLSVVDVIYFIIYNTIYGWNKYPIDETEKTLDYFFELGLILALVYYLVPLVKIYRKKVEELDN
jgi:hypothetical protein